jgi:hypothetical protein
MTQHEITQQVQQQIPTAGIPEVCRSLRVSTNLVDLPNVEIIESLAAPAFNPD